MGVGSVSIFPAFGRGSPVQGERENRAEDLCSFPSSMLLSQQAPDCGWALAGSVLVESIYDNSGKSCLAREVRG